MTAWEILTGNSDAPEGSTAWLHLNSQVGGTGEKIFVQGLLTSSIKTNLTSSIDLVLTSSISNSELTSNVDNDINTGMIV